MTQDCSPQHVDTENNQLGNFNQNKDEPQLQKNSSEQNSKKPIFKNKFKFVVMIFHTSINILQYAVCLSLLNTILVQLPTVLGWKASEVEAFTGLVNSANTAGAAIGCISSGYLSALYGRRTLFIVGDIFCIVGSAIMLIQNTGSFVFGRFICGIGMGILVDLAVLFVIEYTYYIYRGYTGAPMVCFTPIGLIISSCIGLGAENGGDQYWRIVIAIPGMISLFHLLTYKLMCPNDSPYYIYQKYRDEEKVMQVLSEYYYEDAAKDILNKIKEAIIAQTKEKAKKHLSLLDLVKNSGYRMRLFVASLCVFSVNFSGYFIITVYTNIIIMKETNDNQYATYFSLYTSLADLFSVALSVFVIERVGRKFLYQSGQLFCAIMLLIIGFLAHYGTDSPIKFLLIVFKIGFGLTISPLYPIILSELVPEVGFVVTSIVFWVLNTAIVQSFPSLIASDLGFDGMFWLFGAVMSVIFVLLAIYMKETKGKTQYEIYDMYTNPKKASSQTKVSSVQELPIKQISSTENDS
ncbi:hypothetical protein ABPG74_021454 [Tetrahymena malaccensis]